MAGRCSDVQTSFSFTGARLNQGSTDSQYAIKQSFDMFGAGCVIDDAHSQHRSAEDLRGRHQVFALELNLIANRGVDLINRFAGEVGRSKPKA